MDPRAQIRRFILQNYLFTEDASALVDGDSLMMRGIIDSTGALEVVFFLEETFGIKVAEEEMVPENLDSVDRLVAFLTRKQAAAA